MNAAPSLSSVGQDLEQLCVNTIRTLSIDGVQAANSGHPGTPMAMAPVAYCLWQQFLRFDPQDPVWPNRDRFVLSIGHASMLLYSLLHLSGVRAVSKDYETLGELSVPLDALKTFRQLDSRCPGHPEVPLDVRRGNHNWTVRARSGNQCRHRRCPTVVVGSLSPARLRRSL
jgi:transketolase